jgi:hypothetical protein
MTTKVCKACKREKPLAAFYANAGGRQGREAHCIECARNPERKLQPKSKTCRICRKEKPSDLFGANARCKDGLRNECKACANASRKKSPQPKPNYPRQAAHTGLPLSALYTRADKWHRGAPKTGRQAAHTGLPLSALYTRADKWHRGAPKTGTNEANRRVTRL